MKYREEYPYESVKEYLHKQLTLIIAGPPCEEDRTHYIVDQFSESLIPILYLDYDDAEKKYTIEYCCQALPIKRLNAYWQI